MKKYLLTLIILPIMAGCSSMMINNSLWDIAERNGEDQIFAAKVNGTVKKYVWISEEINPLGRKNVSVSLGWGNEEGLYMSGKNTLPEKSVARAYQRALKKGMNLLGKHAHVTDVRDFYKTDSESGIISGRINVLMSAP